MDAEKRLKTILSSSAVFPDYFKKWSSHGQMLIGQAFGQQLSSVTDKSTVLDVGQPNVSLTPITRMTLQLSDGEEVSVEKDLLQSFTKYNFSDGLPELKQWLLDLQRLEHNPPNQMSDNPESSFDLCVTNGITDASQICIKSIMDAEDTILMEDISYINFINNLKTQGLEIQGVASDNEGMIPEALEDLLKHWDETHPGRKLPKIMYAVTSASNPMGYNWSLDRMLDVYGICRKYDILILDDGAYHFLQYGPRPRSFQSFDVDGRVIRLDTFSKIIGAGYRVGWLSGPSAVVEKVVNNHELSCVHPSVIAQVALFSVLNNWGTVGFERRVKTVSMFYKERADCVVKAFDKYLSGLATWTLPRGGMFTWISFKGSVSCNGEDVVRELLEEHHVHLISGKSFYANATGPDDKSIRLCYSTASPKAITKAIKCLADVLKRRSSQANGGH